MLRRLGCTFLLVLCALLAHAAVAAADEATNWFLVNGQDELTNHFGSSDTVLVDGSAVGGVGLIPAVDIYLVENQAWSGHDGEALLDVSNQSHTPNTAIGFEIIDLPIWFPYLRVGGFDVVIDNNQNGVYDEGVDDVIGYGQQPGLTVFFDGNANAIEKQALKNAYAAPWQHVADAAHEMTEMVHTFQLVDQAQSAAGWVQSAYALWDPPPPFYGYLPCVTTSCGPAAHAVTWTAENLEPASTVWNGPPKVPWPSTICTDAVERALPGEPVSCKVPNDPTAAFSSESFGAKQLELATANLDSVVKGIVADPPDPDYQHLWTYQPPATTFTAAAPESPAPEQAVLANRINEAALRSQGLLDSIQRFDGAIQAGDQYWAGLQATVISEQSYALADLLTQINDDSTAAANAMRQSGSSGWNSDFASDLATLQARLSASGLTAAERTAFTDDGWTQDQVDQLVSDVLAVPAGDLPADLPTTLDEAANITRPAVDALWNLGVYAEDVAATKPHSKPPLAQFSWSPPDSQLQRKIAFDASGSSDADGAITKYEWNFGDATTGTGVTPTHTYSSPGWYQVTLTVTDDSNTTASTGQWVYASDVSPTAVLSATPESGSAPLSVSFDGAGSTDPDGSIASYHWDFGDGATSKEAAPTHDYPFPGTYTVWLTVADNDGSSGLVSKLITVDSAAAPTAAFSAAPDHGLAPLDVSFDASGSTDPGGEIQEYTWEFGDGRTGGGVSPQHTYESAGTFTVTLVVTGSTGAKDKIRHDVLVTWPNRPPSPADDSIDAAKAAALDVLANDADPDNDEFTLTSNTDPAHGKATCSATGACGYFADPGYDGPDSFGYTITDPDGLSGTATVHLNVSQPPSADEGFVLRDDDAAAPHDGAVEINVLANDAAPQPLSIVSTTDPQHGSVTCDDGGVCSYEPHAGYDGDDGFTYTAADGNHQGTADVHITVSPATSFNPHVTAQPVAADELIAGAEAQWGVGASASPPGVSDDALHAGPPPGVAVRLEGSQVLDTGSVVYAKGWSGTVDFDKGEVHAEPGTDALLGSVSEAFPKPLPPISQGTGGDGHVPILVGSKVFAFFHHSSPTAVTCVDRRTCQRCPGYPHQLNVASSSIIGPGAVVGTRIYVHAFTATWFRQSAAIGLYCWDASTDAPCGMVIAARTPSANEPGGSAPVAVGGKVYFAGPAGKLYCVDPSTNSLCGQQPAVDTGLATSFANSEWDIVAHGSRVFVSRRNGGAVACIDIVAGAPCTGWTNPEAIGLGGWNLVTWHGTSGAAIGVCVATNATLSCVHDNDPSDITTFTGWPGPDAYYNVTEEAETGTRTLVAALGVPGVGCWDWVVAGTCTGGAFAGSGWLYSDVNGSTLPSAYGVAWDGSCAVALGDPGMVFTADPTGSSPCNSLTSGATSRVLDLRDQRCDGGVGSASWAAVKLADAAPGELDLVSVTVRDASTGEVLAHGDTLNDALDLSGINAAAHPAITVEGNVRSAPGNAAWVDAVPPRLAISWNPDPQQICFRSQTPRDCSAGPKPVRGVATIAGVSSSVELPVKQSDECPVESPSAAPNATTPDTPASQAAPREDPPRQSGEQGAAQVLLGCSNRKLVLEDVLEQGGRVRLVGVAMQKFAGQQVSIVFTATHQVVAHATVGKDGWFRASAPLPPRSIRASNRARYQALIGKQRSLNLKLFRRMVVTAMHSSHRRVTIDGRAIPPLALRARDRTITLQRYVSCSRTTDIARFKPRADGRFTITVPAPKNGGAAVYRMRTQVRNSLRSKKLGSTFTLPRAIDFK